MADRSATVRISLLLAAAGALFGGVIWYVSGPLKCQRLEEDYLNSVASMRSAIALQAFDRGGGEVAQAAKSIEKSNRDQMEESLSAIYVQCGERAGQTAFRRASEQLVGS